MLCDLSQYPMTLLVSLHHLMSVTDIEGEATHAPNHEKVVSFLRAHPILLFFFVCVLILFYSFSFFAYTHHLVSQVQVLH